MIIRRSDLNNLSLGKQTDYASTYSPELLQAVPRSLGRDELGIKEIDFYGVDVWHGYELSWLNNKGKPQVALMRCSVPATTPNIVESKSFKLYLNSFNQTRFPYEQIIKRTLEKDLSSVAGGQVKVEIISASDASALPNTPLPGKCIDDLDIEITNYALDKSLLKYDDEQVSETLHSHLLKSNCLITNQPDWASVIIDYSGNKINQESLLRYLISFREHNEFHEQCVERIFTDITHECQPENLSVQALYTRRGGLDICPFRSSKNDFRAPVLKTIRQ